MSSSTSLRLDGPAQNTRNRNGPPHSPPPTSSVDIPSSQSSAIEHLFADIDNLTLRLNNANPEEQAQIRSEIATTTATLEKLTLLRRGSIQPTPSMSTSAPKLPKFSGSTPNDVHHFITRFEHALRNHDSACYAEHLSDCFDDNTMSTWIINNIPINTPWPVARSRFLDRFGLRDPVATATAALDTITRNPAEYLRSFCGRFTDLLKLAKFDVYDEGPLGKHYTKILVERLPKSIQETFLLVRATNRAISSSVASVCLFVSDLEDSLTHQGTVVPAYVNASTTDTALTTPRRTYEFRCQTCRTNDHSYKDCSVLAAKKRERLALFPNKTGRPTDVTCYKCKEKGHYANKCPNEPAAPSATNIANINTEPKTAVAPTNQTPSSPPYELDTDENFTTADFQALFGSSNSASLSAVASTPSLDPIHAHRPPQQPATLIPFMMDDHKVFGVVDSAADITFLNADFAAKLGLPLLPRDQAPVNSVTLADPNYRVSESVQFTQPLLVRLKGKSVPYSFGVMPLGDKQALFGRDLLHYFGIGISGLPAAFDDSAALNRSPVHAYSDSKPNSLPTSEPNHPDVLLAVRTLLKENQNPERRGKFCNVPAAEISLPTAAASHSFITQYPIADRMKPAVSERVASWLKEGIIEPAPPLCAWNSPLLAVAKKDELGGKQKFAFALTLATSTNFSLTTTFLYPSFKTSSTKWQAPNTSPPSTSATATINSPSNPPTATRPPSPGTEDNTCFAAPLSASNSSLQPFNGSWEPSSPTTPSFSYTLMTSSFTVPTSLPTPSTSPTS